MTRLERLGLLAWFVLVLVGLATQAPVATALGAVGGAGGGLLAVPRLHRLRSRMDATLGADAAPARRLRPRRLGLRIGAHVAVLLVVLLTTVVVPFVGDELFAALAAAATGLPLVLTAARLRR